MAPVEKMTRSTELRHLTPEHRIKLSEILDEGSAWKRLAEVIPEPDAGEGQLLTAGNIHTLEQHQRTGASPSQALLTYWGTCGRKRATLALFLDLLVKSQLFRAAHYLCLKVLQIDPVTENDFSVFNSNESIHVCQAANGENNFDVNASPNDISSKIIDFDQLNISSSDCNISSDLNDNVNPTAPIESLISSSINDPTFSLIEISKFSFEQLKVATNNFNDVPLSEGGCRLGRGAVGTVYRASFSDGRVFAVKKLINKVEKQFAAELQIMIKLKHENLLSLCGISYDGSSLCLIYDYMSNGSVFDRIHSYANSTQPLDWQTRVSIAIGTARGIVHLHTASDKPFVHRDIKSANILLDDGLTPKVGDFGLTRIGSNGLTTTTNSMATTVMGTSAYMAPEAFQGQVTVQMDTFSFGIVLLELLTGILPWDEGREERDILSYLDEQINEDEDNILINTFIDPAAGQWNEKIAQEMYKISRACTQQRRKQRPSMVEVLELLEKLTLLL